MGTEYYIVKPKQQKIFYLGRRISYLDGITSWHESALPVEQFCEWECYEDVVADINENCRYFLQQDLMVGQVWDFANAIYEFCDDKVYLDDDCSPNFVNWKDWEEIDVYSDILTTKEAWCELIQLVPRDKWIVNNSIINEYETIASYLQEIKEEREKQKC